MIKAIYFPLLVTKLAFDSQNSIFFGLHMKDFETIMRRLHVLGLCFAILLLGQDISCLHIKEHNIQ